jgi:hypothetical protein
LRFNRFGDSRRGVFGGGDGGVVGEDVDDDVGAGGDGARGGGAVLASAFARQGLGAGAQGAEGVGAPFGGGAGVVVADGVGEVGDAAFQCEGVGGVEPRPQAGVAGFVAGGAEGGVAAAVRVPPAAQPGGVDRGDRGVDGGLGFGVRQFRHPGGLLGQGGVELGLGGGVDDVAGARDDGADQHVADQSLGEQGGDFGEAVVQGDGAVGLVQGQGGADVLGGAEFGAGGGDRVQPPAVALGGGVAAGAATEQFSGDGEFAGAGGVLGSCAGTEGLEQGGVAQPGQVVGIR